MGKYFLMDQFEVEDVQLWKWEDRDRMKQNFWYWCTFILHKIILRCSEWEIVFHVSIRRIWKYLFNFKKLFKYLCIQYLNTFPDEHENIFV